MKRMKQSNITKKMLAFALILALILTISPLSTWASIDSSQEDAYEASQITLGTSVPIGTPQTVAGDNHKFKYIWKKFRVTAASKLTVTVSAPKQNTDMLPNRLVISITQPNDDIISHRVIKNTDGKESAEVVSNEDNVKTVYCKVMPGTYFIRAEQWSDSYNGYGTVRVDATAAPADSEPNDSHATAQPAKLNTTYYGNIGYYDSNYTWDRDDYYKFTVPSGVHLLEITFSRTNDGKELNLRGNMGEGSISLLKTFSDTYLYYVEDAGTYYFDVSAEFMELGDCTEYTLNIHKWEGPSITLTNKKNIDKGKSFKLTAKVKPTTPKRTITWTSSNTRVAKVLADGTVKGVGVGTATITAKVNEVSGVSATCQVTVRQPVTKLTLNKKSILLKKGKTFKLKATIKPKTATIKTIKWSSSNKNVATVSSKGVVKAKKKGTTYITAKSYNGKTVKCKVKVTK